MFFKVQGVPIVIHEITDALFLESLYQFCASLEQEILGLPLTWSHPGPSPVTARFGSYNFLQFENPVVGQVREVIRFACAEMSQNLQGFSDEGDLWIQSWVNIHHRNQFLQRHSHFPGFLMHGHLTVHTKGTYTFMEKTMNSF